MGIDDLLSAPGCQHIVIEGEPGIGKTTLCHKLAHDWATAPPKGHHQLPAVHNGNGTAGIHRFKFVFFMEARRLEEASLIDCIYSSLLPEDFVVSKEVLAGLLERPEVQEEVLFIIDAYDELSQANEQLRKLIERRIYSRCSLIVTTRPTYANTIISHFDTMYVILGYPLRKRKEFIRKYVEETKADIKLFRTLERNLLENDTVSDLSRNPLYLWFLCMLVEDNEGRLPETRTELFQEVIDLLLRKAHVKLNMPKADCDAYFKCLCRLAFESHKLGKVHFNQALLKRYFPFEDTSVLGKLGFLAREMSSSRLRPNLLFTFTHKTIQEFLAANYLLSMPEEKRVSFVQKRRKERHWWMVWIFLSGLLQGDDSALKAHYSSGICKDLSPTVNMATGVSSTDLVHNNYHLGLQCLGESGLFEGFELLASQIVPPTFVYHVMACHYCLQGFLMAHTDGIPTHQPDLVINGLDLEMYRMFDYKLLDAMSTCENLQSLVIAEVMSLNLLMEYLTKFLASDLRLRRLYIYISQAAHPDLEQVGLSMQELRRVFRAVGSLEVLVLCGSFVGRLKGGESIAQGLELLLVLLLSNIGPNLTTLVLDAQTMTPNVTGALLSRLQHCPGLTHIHLKNLHFAPGQFELLTKGLADRKCLARLHLAQCGSESPEGFSRKVPDCLAQLLGAAPLKEVNFFDCALCDEAIVEPILAHLKGKDTLTHFELVCNPLSLELREQLRTTLQTLRQLQHLTLCDIGTTADEVADLSVLLHLLPSLRSLDLSNSDIGASAAFSQLTTAVQLLQQLRTLKLNTCNISDDSFHHFRDVLLKVPLREVSLLGNPIGESPTGIEEILSVFEVSQNLQSLSLTCVKLSSQVGLSLGKALSGNKNLKALNLLCYPMPGMFERKAYEAFYKAMYQVIPSLQDFSVGVNMNVQKGHIYRKTNHAYYRNVCLEPPA